MNRRAFIAMLGSSALAARRAAHAQQQALPVIGFLDPRTPDVLTDRLREFRRGLKETGYVEGENVSIVYRYAENDLDRLPGLAAELARRPVAVIVASGGPGVAIAAKAATTTTPVVFAVGEDPVRLGFVASLARPGGNLTGINFFNTEVTAKRLELLRELVPGATRVAVLVNPANPATETTLRDVEPAARAMGLQLASRHAVPATFSNRDFAEVGGLISYGANPADALRQVGVYAGRILKGAKPADLPVVQASKLELVINAQTARTIGLTVPDKLLALADEVIE